VWRWLVSPVLSLSGLLGLFAMPQDLHYWLNKAGIEGLWVAGMLVLLLMGVVLFLDQSGVLGSIHRPAKTQHQAGQTSVTVTFDEHHCVLNGPTSPNDPFQDRTWRLFRLRVTNGPDHDALQPAVAITSTTPPLQGVVGNNFIRQTFATAQVPIPRGGLAMYDLVYVFLNESHRRRFHLHLHTYSNTLFGPGNGPWDVEFVVTCTNAPPVHAAFRLSFDENGEPHFSLTTPTP
jgi:hypothetical protein